MKMLGQDQLQKRLTVTNFLHFVYNEIGNGSAAQDLQLIRSLLDDNKFLPTVQDGKHYVHGYFEWKLLLILIAEKSDGCANILKDLCVQLMGYSICIVGVSNNHFNLGSSNHMLSFSSRTLISVKIRHSHATVSNLCGPLF